MKHIFKITRYLLVMMLFWGCQQDDAIITESNQKQTFQKTKTVVSIDQIFGLETIVGKVQTMRRSQNQSGTLSKNNTYLENLDLENIVSIADSDGNQSYTIDIVNPQNGINFEKLRLVKYMDGYIASIQRFEPNQAWYDSGENMNTFTGQIQNMTLNGTVTWSATLNNGLVVNNNNGTTAKSGSPCIINIYWEDEEGVQYEDDPTDGDNYTSAQITMVVDIDCSGSGSSSGGGSGYNSGGGYPNGGLGSSNGTFVGGSGGSTSGGSNNNPPDGSDTGCTNCDTGTSFDLNEQRTKDRLLAMSNDVKIKARLQDCKEKAEDANHIEEGGGAFRKKSDGTYFERLPSVIQGTETGFDPGYISGESVFVHLHSQKAYDYSEGLPQLKDVAPIPSKVDIVKFISLMYERNNDTNEPSYSDDDDEIVSMLVTDQGTYALTVGNKANMLAADVKLNSENRDQKVINEFVSEYEIKIKEACNNDDACLLRTFLNFIKTHTIDGNTLGIDIYQAVYENNEITGWIKL